MKIHVWENMNCDSFFYFFLFLCLGVQSHAVTGSEDVIVLRVNAELSNAHAL